MPTNKELESKIESLTKVVETLVNNLPKKEESKIEIKVENPASSEEEKWVLQELGGFSEPIPVEYRGVVDNVLNKSFGIHVKGDIGKFIFSILVPRKYSLMSAEQWKMYHFDRRPKAITYAEGLEGVKIWADKVFSSFAPEYQSMIVADRVAGI